MEVVLTHPAFSKEESEWEYSTRLRDLIAAQKWGYNSPEDFDNQPKDKRLDTIAWYEAMWRIKAIRDYEANEKAKREAERQRTLNKR